MTDFLLLAFTFLVAGVISVPIATRLGLGSVLGYLIAGIVISPVLALLRVDVVSIQHFAEFGVVMMLFLVGLELEPKHLWSMRGRLMGLGGGQIGLTVALVYGAGVLLGLPWSVALAVGLVFALSSTAIVLQTLGEKGLMKSDGGQSSFAVLLTQDIAVIPMLAFLPLLALPELADHAAVVAHGVEEAAHGAAEAGHDEGGHGPAISLVEGLNGWQTALVTFAAVAAVVIGGSYLTTPVFRFIAAAGLRELFTATALLMVVGIALLMLVVGLSPALGTFLAGVVLANSPYRHELESDIDPFRGLLLGLFFMTVGASINFGLLFENLFSILGMTIGLMTAKVAVLLVLAVVFRIRGADRWLFALGLAQAGEFGFVLLSFTVANGVIPTALADQLLLVVALSMLLTPGLFILYDRVIAPRFSTVQEREPDEMPGDRQIIIAGAGRMGGLIDRVMRAAGLSTTVIDYNARRLDILERFGTRHYYGDASRPDLLHAAGIAEAKMLIVAIDDREQINEIVRHVGKTYPQVHIVARAIDRDHVYDLWYYGCRDIIRETFDSSMRMSRSVFEAMGIEREVAQRMIDAFVERDQEAMLEAAEAYDIGVPLHENPAYVELVRSRRGTWEAEIRERMERIRDGGT
ncbi:cation:proton antiporter [Roseovarius indicus]|uniref:K(+)/H(+) antiporter n=1 Tax=Roseovarius indicus TaxID=540747 RepID=A0A0T5PB47_9RHOB|nr:cation:proton antiporter [Roseovarius indicus]KRS18341.1 potassium transporter [Roseovarius indicus]QEW26810.1 K(+)/H(+) antiporter [Roseovarius indicus]SFD59712.1 Kef-type potassium/proton antiporter, CPA2 family [Roseovarius indicus]